MKRIYEANTFVKSESSMLDKLCLLSSVHENKGFRGRKLGCPMKIPNQKSNFEGRGGNDCLTIWVSPHLRIFLFSYLFLLIPKKFGGASLKMALYLLIPELIL
jgi:hypothetical protein